MAMENQMQGPQSKLQTKPKEKPENPEEIDKRSARHFPFAEWCDTCVRTKSREDRTIANADFKEEEDSGMPHIQMDWMYLGRNCPALVVLVVMARYTAVFPTRTKGAWKSVAEWIVKFSLEMNRVDDCVFVMDAEPATLGMLDIVVSLGHELGYKAQKKWGKPYHKGRTARVERFIQTLKRLPAAVVVYIEEQLQATLDEVHCLRAWALVHACFLLNLLGNLFLV